DYLFPQEEAAPDEVLFIAALAELLRERQWAETCARRDSHPASPWHARDGWRLNATARRVLFFRRQEQDVAVEVAYLPDAYRLSVNGRSVIARGELNPCGLLLADLDGKRLAATVIEAAGRLHVFVQGRTWPLAAVNPLHCTGEGG